MAVSIFVIFVMANSVIVLYSSIESSEINSRFKDFVTDTSAWYDAFVSPVGSTCLSDSYWWSVGGSRRVFAHRFFLHQYPTDGGILSHIVTKHWPPEQILTPFAISVKGDM